MMCDECGKIKFAYLRLIVFANDGAFEREFCSMDCLRNYTINWSDEDVEYVFS